MSSHPVDGMANEGLPNMWTTNRFAARTLIWLAAIAVPVQGISAASCGCARSKSCIQKNETSNDRRCCTGTQAVARQTCCSAAQPETASTCCCSKTSEEQGDAGTCGKSCQCSSAEQRPMPTTLPVDKNMTGKLRADSASTDVITGVDQQHGNASSTTDALGAQDRCVSLCRLTL